MSDGPPGYVLVEARKLINRLLHLVGDESTVLEIGANDGMHTRLFTEEFSHPNFRMWCFEPDPRAAARFRRSVHQDPRCRPLEEIALGDRDGTATFYQSGGTTEQSWLADWDLSGSLRRPTGHLAMSPWVTFDRQIEVPIRRLDSWMAEHPEIDAVDLVWMDVQGAEGDVIRGGLETFTRRVTYLFMEAYEKELYEGQLLRSQLLGLLPNFELVSVFGDDVLLRNKTPEKG